jgi:NTE family protein
MESQRGFGLVLGAGGTVGMAYLAGALHALHEVAGLDATRADLVVGTSAGSAVGAMVRSGWSTDDVWAMATGSHEALEEFGAHDVAARRRAIFHPAWGTPGELARRGVGSAYVMARSVLRGPGPRVPSAWARRFPGGLFSMAEARQRFAELMGESWPERPLWLCTVDITSGRRVVLGRDGAPTIPLPQAVLASCAIPGVYEPVRAGPRLLVDGGVRSSTNLDLAAGAGCRTIVCVAPMAYDPQRPPDALRQLVRRIPARALARETAFARSRGADVLLVRPTARELRVHGGNLMRADAGEQIARAAYESTAELASSERFTSVLGRLTAA